MKRGATIFVADDNSVLLRALKQVLCGHGYDVRTTSHGRAILDLLERTPIPPDLLLLDVMMPEMSGIEVLQAVRADPRWSHLPVLLISACEHEALPMIALRGGAAGFLTKPFRLGELLARIEFHLGRPV